MQDGPQLREQLRSLSIPREQRPASRDAAAPARGRVGTVAILTIAVLALAGYVAWDKFGARIRGAATAPTSQPAGNAATARATSQPATQSAPVLTATGKIVSDHRVEVATKVSGQVVALYFEQGDRVERGQLLARIEDVAYKARRDEAAANLERAQANLAFQQINFERIARLHETNQASDMEYAEARRAFEDARAQVDAGEAALAFVAKLLRDCEVVAPISGVILERSVEVGDFVAAEGGRGAMANSQFAAIADMTKLRVEVDISELDIGRLRTDMPCIVTPDARKERHYRGRVMWLDPGANYSKATVQVKVRIENPDVDLRVEGAAQVQFLVYERETTTRSATP